MKPYGSRYRYLQPVWAILEGRFAFLGFWEEGDYLAYIRTLLVWSSIHAPVQKMTGSGVAETIPNLPVAVLPACLFVLLPVFFS